LFAKNKGIKIPLQVFVDMLKKIFHKRFKKQIDKKNNNK